MKSFYAASFLVLILSSCAQQISKEQLVTRFHTFYTSSDWLADEMKPYLKCYDENEQTLLSDYKEIYNDCIDKSSENMPPIVTVPSDKLTRFGKQIDNCANHNFYKKHKNNFEITHLTGQDMDTCLVHSKSMGRLQEILQWEYIHKLPIERAGNSYLAEYNGQRLAFIRVADNFSFSGQNNNNGLLSDIFSSPGGNLPAVYVVNRFGVFREKAKINLSTTRNFILHESSATNQKHYILVQNIEQYDTIIYVIVHSDASEGGFINSIVTYAELLPAEYPFETWDSSVLAERKKFVAAFEKRARKAVQYNPRDTNNIQKSDKASTEIPDHKARLLELKSLFNEGIINEAEYEQKRKSIFDDL